MGIKDSFSRLYADYRKYYIILAVGVFVLSVGGYGGLQYWHESAPNEIHQMPIQDVSGGKTVSVIKPTKTLVNPTVSTVSYHDEFAGKVMQGKIVGPQKADQSHRAFGITADQMSLTTTSWIDSDNPCDNSLGLSNLGNIYMACMSNRINFFNFTENTKKSWIIPDGYMAYYDSNVIKEMATDSQNDLFFSVNRFTDHRPFLAKLNYDTDVFSIYSAEVAPNLSIDSNGDIIMTEQKLKIFEPAALELYSYNVNCSNHSDVDFNNNVICVSFDDSNKILRLDRATNTLSTWNLPAGYHAKGIVADSVGDIFFIESNNLKAKVGEIPIEGDTLIEWTIPNLSESSEEIIIDSSGNIFFNVGSLTRFVPATGTFTEFSTLSCHGSIILEDNDDIFCKTTRVGTYTRIH